MWIVLDMNSVIHYTTSYDELGNRGLQKGRKKIRDMNVLIKELHSMLSFCHITIFEYKFRLKVRDRACSYTLKLAHIGKG